MQTNSRTNEAPAIRELRERLARFRSKTTDPLLSTDEGETKRRMNIYAERKGIDLNTHEGTRQALSDISAGRDEERPDTYENLIAAFCRDNNLNPANYADRREAISKLRPALDHVCKAGL